MGKASLATIPESPEVVPPGASIKDAYNDWLRDVDALTRKRKDKKKSKRLAALRHLTQPTESSSKKQVDVPTPDGATRGPIVESSEDAAASRAETQRRRFQSLADEASYAHFSYDAPWSPGLAFFELLANHAESRLAAAAVPGHKPGFRSSSNAIARREMAHFPVRVPPTVFRLTRQSQGVVLLFTVEQELEEPQVDTTSTAKPKFPNSKASESDEATQLDWTLQFHYFSTPDIFESRLPWILRTLTRCEHDQDCTTVAVLKRPSLRGNRVETLSSQQAIEEALRSLWDDESSASGRAVQAYIASKGAAASSGGKAWIARPAYRKKDRSAATVWILTGTNALLATTEWAIDSASTTPPCQLVKCTTPQSWQTPRIIVETLCHSLDVGVLRASGVGSFAELVVDLVQDAHGHWWLLQVKAFQLRRSQLPPSVHRGEVSCRARSAPDRLETLSVISSGTKASSFLTKAKWKCAGNYCHFGSDHALFGDDNATNNPGDQDEPSGYLTKKELLSCEFFDKFHGSDDASLSGGRGSFSSALSFHLQHQLKKRDRVILYEPQALCGVCIHRYYALRTAMGSLTAIDSDNAATKKPLLSRGVKTSKLPTSKSATSLPTDAHITRLPPLASTIPMKLRTSQSTPEITTDTVAMASPPSYMDELAQIERLLADGNHSQSRQHEPEQPLMPPQASATPTTEVEDDTVAADPYLVRNVKATSAFSWEERGARGDRVEEMWESIKPKPLTTSIASRHVSRAYNSFSLETALRETALSSAPPTDQQHKHLEPAHLISIVDCRRIFSDEAFRESLVRETTQHLLVRQQPVRFVVLPTENQEQEPSSHDLALGRMALRTLALDIGQSLTQEGISMTRGLPTVDCDAAQSGCLFMTVPVPGSNL